MSHSQKPGFSTGRPPGPGPAGGGAGRPVICSQRRIAGSYSPHCTAATGSPIAALAWSAAGVRVGLAGIAMPGLRHAAGSLAAAYRGDPADLQAEVLTGFLAAVRALDPTIWSPCRWRPGCAGGPGSSMPAPTPAGLPAATTWPGGAMARTCPGDPDFVLATAVRRGSSPAAGPLSSAGTGSKASRCRRSAPRPGSAIPPCTNRRKRTEKAITDAIRSGLIADLFRRPA
jgi:hypothetical protein